jgi:hypothetical protein
VAFFDISKIVSERLHAAGIKTSECSGCMAEIFNGRGKDGLSLMLDTNILDHKKVCTGRKPRRQ